jgi:hypothetical protein
LIEIGGCVFIREPSLGHRWLVIWPVGYSKHGDSIRDGDGTAIARIGDEITLGGGEIKADEFDFLRGKLATDVPEGCRGSDYWVTDGPASAG